MSRSLLAVVVLASSLGLIGCNRSEASASAGQGTSSQPSGRIEIAVTSDGFVPAQARVKVGQPVTLVVTRKVDVTCALDIVIKEYGIKKALPLNQAVEVTFTPTKPGKIRYSCAMDMLAGELVAE